MAAKINISMDCSLRNKKMPMCFGTPGIDEGRKYLLTTTHLAPAFAHNNLKGTTNYLR